MDCVASFAEAWIEIPLPAHLVQVALVASFAEAWIEISTPDTSKRTGAVASFAEAWIEITTWYSKSVKGNRRLLRGGVD